MKIRNIKSILLFLCMFLFVECDDELDLGPLGELNSNTFYKTEKDFDAASLSTYSTLLNLYFDQNGLGMLRGLELISDDVRNPQGNNNNEEFQWLPNNDDYGYIWEQCYRGIMRANVILNQLPEADEFADESNKARPFCCDRCKLIDLGAWASESYQIPVQPSDEAYEDYSSGYDASGLSTNATKH